MCFICPAGFRQFGRDIKVIAARLTYENTKLTMKLLFGDMGDFRKRSSMEWQHCFELNDVIIPPGMHACVNVCVCVRACVYVYVYMYMRASVCA